MLAVLFIDEVASIGFLLDDTLISEGIGVLAHRDHAIICTRLDRVGYLYEVSLGYQVADSRVREHDLTDSYTTSSIYTRYESLREYSDERV